MLESEQWAPVNPKSINYSPYRESAFLQLPTTCPLTPLQTAPSGGHPTLEVWPVSIGLLTYRKEAGQWAKF